MKKIPLLILLFPLNVHAFFLNVVASTAAPANIGQLFITNATTYFNASLFVNPFASNTYSITLFGKGQPVTVLGNSEDECLAMGFGSGMDGERYEDMTILQSFQNTDISSKTCAGVVVSSTTYLSCQLIYNLVGNAIMKRWNAIYSSSGSVIAP